MTNSINNNQTTDGAVSKKITGFSIKTKLTFVIVILVLISLTIVSAIVSYKGEETLIKQAEDNLTLITNQKAKEYNAVFSRIHNEIEGMAIFSKSIFQQPINSGYLNFSVLMPWTGNTYGNLQMRELLSDDIVALQYIGLSLQGLVKENPYLEIGYMATENNVMVFDNENVVNVIKKEEGYVPTKRPWYIDAIDQKDTIWTQPYIDVVTKKLVVTCASPVFNQSDEIIGVVGFDVLLDTIQKDIISLDIGYNSHAFLLAQNGNLLAKPNIEDKDSSWNKAVKTDSAMDTENEEFKRIVLSMIAGNSGMGSHTENNERILVSYAPIGAINASVGIVISEKEIMKPAVDIRRLVMGVWVGVVIFTIFCGLAIGNGITKPINDLSRRAYLISQGKSDLAEITSTRKDEIGLLIESYNRLITSLKLAISRRKR